MHDAQQTIERYFTEQIVGAPFSITLGPTEGQHRRPSRGVLVDHLEGAVRASLLATRTAWAEDPSEVVVGRPFSLPELQRWRRDLLLGAWFAWSLLLVALVWWWRS